MARGGIAIEQLSSLTHGHAIATRACRLYCEIGRRIARGTDKPECVRGLSDREVPYERIEGIARLPKDAIRSSGYVVDALEAALWSFMTTDSFEDCIL